MVGKFSSVILEPPSGTRLLILKKRRDLELADVLTTLNTTCHYEIPDLSARLTELVQVRETHEIGTLCIT